MGFYEPHGGIVLKTAPAATLTTLPLNALQPHPDNPRQQLRQDVVDQIAQEIAQSGVFADFHALLVRPYGDAYQIVSGHHRRAAALQAGIDAVPCWVVEMSDEEAFFRLLMDNNQGELSPLERAFHVRRYVERYSRNGGNTSEYATRTGIAQPQVTQLMQAAEVAESIKRFILSDSVRLHHLRIAHGAPRHLWPSLVETTEARAWSTRVLEDVVQAVKSIRVPEQITDYVASDALQSAFVEECRDRMPRNGARSLAAQYQASVDEVVRAITALPWEVETWEFSGGEPRPIIKTPRQDLAAWIPKGKLPSADAIRHWTQNYVNRLKELEAAYQAWKDARNEEERAALLLQQREAEVRQRFVHGDARAALASCPNGVRLLLTDPPYGMGFSSNHRVVSSKVDAVANDTEDAPALFRQTLDALAPKLLSDAHLLVFCHWRMEPAFRSVIEEAGFELKGVLTWVKENWGSGDLENAFAPQTEFILHAARGSPGLSKREPNVFNVTRDKDQEHPEQKPVALLTRLIEATTSMGDLVVDPFAGSASTLVAAQALDRAWWGCEVDADWHTQGLRRLLNHAG